MIEATLWVRLSIDLFWGWIFFYIFCRIHPAEIALSIPRRDMLWVFECNPLTLPPHIIVQAVGRISFKEPADILRFLWRTALVEDKKQRENVNETLRITTYEIAKLPHIENEWLASGES